MYNSSNHPVFTYESLKGRELNWEEDRIWRINEKSMKKKKIETISFLVVLYLIIIVSWIIHEHFDLFSLIIC